jgi:hypothetical protein
MTNKATSGKCQKCSKFAYVKINKDGVRLCADCRHNGKHSIEEKKGEI